VRHVLVVANETVVHRALLDAVAQRVGASGGEDDEGRSRATVVCPISRPREGYVVYENTRRAAAGRRLDRTLAALRDAGVPADGYVADNEPADAVRDALDQLEPPVTAIVVSTHPEEKSGWLRRSVVDRIRSVAGDVAVEHVPVSADAAEGPDHILVIANETLLGQPLLDRIRERARRSPATFLIVAPQSDPDLSDHRAAERRLRRALAELRADGLEVHGQIAHPDPYTAGMQAVHDERVDELIVSTFGASQSGWLRRDVVERLRRDARLPVDHVVVRDTTAQPAAR
jgi:hypothetical protein